MVVVLLLLLVLLLGLEFVCLGLLALLLFRAAGLVLIDLQLQRLLVVFGVALTRHAHDASHLPSTLPNQAARKGRHSCLTPLAEPRVARPPRQPVV